MDKRELLRKLETILDAAQRDRMWGKIELEIRDGVPAVLRELRTENLKGARVTSHDNRNQG